MSKNNNDKNTNNQNKTINDLIIDEAVKQFKEGKIKNSLDVEDYLDSLLQPLMQKLLDTELENHLEYSKYTHLKGKKIQNKLWICTSVAVKASADRMGYTTTIENAGGNIVCDTCMVVAPIEDMGFKVIGVNSAKAANYIPSMCGLEVRYDDVENLIQFQ